MADLAFCPIRRPLIRPFGAPSPLWGEGFGSAQIGRNLVLCGTFGYIYWELWIGAPIFFFRQIGQPKFALLWIFCENIHLFRIDIIRVKC